MPRRLSIFLCLSGLVAAIPGLAEKEKKIVQLLNQNFGKTEQQMIADWGTADIEQLQDGRKRFVVVSEPVFRSSPGQPGYTTSKTTGQVDRQGNVSLDTTTTDHPPADAIGLYIHTRTIFYFNAQGTVYRWEAYEYPTDARELTEYQQAHPRWEVLDIRELRPNKKGKLTPVKVGNYEGFWFTQ